MTTNDRAPVLAALRGWMDSAGLDGLIVPRTDAHQSEVTAPHDDCLRYLSGFSGSAGLALVLKEKAVIFVDGRYQVQVRQEVDLSLFEIHHLHDDPLDRWLKDHAQPGWRIGIDTMLVGGNLYDRLAGGCTASGAELVTLDADPFDVVWHDRPLPPLGAIRAMSPDVAGETAAGKRSRIAEGVRQRGADILVETLPDNIAWLLNVRGSDVPMNPVPHSFLLLGTDGGLEWFVDRRKLGNDLTAYELADVTLSPPERFLDRLAAAVAGKTAVIDADFAPQAVRAGILAAGGRLAPQTSPITLAKSLKTSAELQGFRDCHLEDGIAVTDFLAWLSVEAPAREKAGRPLTELEAEAQLLVFRQERKDFLEPSFRTISAAGANAAMCHYAASEETNAPIEMTAPYLVDSGGQYLGGTTDLTRTMMLGEPSADMRRAYTAVLKGFISLMSARFPQGTQGHQLDGLARRPLWDIGLDYDHGTGHGVGHNLLIHEYPHRFDRKPNLHALIPGNVMTVEPGYYEQDAFGMRIENQVEVVADGPGFCRFASLTLAPIDLAMADLDTLTASEAAFLDGYHAEVRESLLERVRPETKTFLLSQTRPVVEQALRRQAASSA
ncbi:MULTISPECIES: aminopeptidase P family protein [unclassified Rhizobium]|uniref:aminopeptidase P family protein n=1 Tax=unclassified Rhizobium TaxID=2613769 RepID=UPI0006F9663D|nr:MULTISPECIES: aminopeptidase P family protein [unclassified Rhizobium]KQV43942.1 X-Pro aminopeptidase [Rhizobium sp. Root1212]KRD38123.1 X-Pro aminopeptidase [Rhizobium sp. Root268]